MRSINIGGSIGDQAFNLKEVLITKPAENWTVYMIRCGKGSLYTGISNNVKKRLDLHAQGAGAKYLRGRSPLELVFRVEVADKSAALKLERRLKGLTRVEKERLIETGDIARSEVRRLS